MFLINILFGIILYVAITIVLIGAVFVIREALLTFTGFDLYEWLKNIAPRQKKVKKKVVLNESTDDAWLKDRGRG